MGRSLGICWALEILQRLLCGHMVRRVLKSLWILGKSLKSPWIPFFLEKSLNFCASPWKVLEFSSNLSVVAWKVFFDAFCVAKTEYIYLCFMQQLTINFGHGTVHCLGAGWSQWTTSTKQGTHLWCIAMQLIILHYCMCKEFPLLLWIMAN